MRRILLVSGVLGGGTALVFSLAALTAALFPQGTMVSGQWGGWTRFGGVMPMEDVMVLPAGAEMDVNVAPDVIVKEAPAIEVEPEAAP